MNSPSRYGWLELIEGILLICAGFVTLRCPDHALSGLVIFYGAITAMIGIGEIVFYCRLERHIGFAPAVSLVAGVLCTLVGLCMIAHPRAGVAGFMVLLPVWFIIHSISRLSHLNTVRRIAGPGSFTFSTVLNVIGLVLGILMLVSPNFTMISTAAIIGFSLILIGIDHTALGISDIGTRW